MTGRRSDPTAAALGIGLVWSLTQLGTRDRVTAGPRRRAMAAVLHHRHRPVKVAHAGGARVRVECSCGWWDDDQYEPAAHKLADHIVVARGDDAGPLAEMLDCPWCLSFWVAVPVAAVLALTRRLRPLDALAFPFAARIVAGAAIVHLGPEDETDTTPDSERFRAAVTEIEAVSGE